VYFDQIWFNGVEDAVGVTTLVVVYIPQRSFLVPLAPSPAHGCPIPLININQGLDGLSAKVFNTSGGRASSSQHMSPNSDL
jgi:hypothetical protein